MNLEQILANYTKNYLPKSDAELTAIRGVNTSNSLEDLATIVLENLKHFGIERPLPIVFALFKKLIKGLSLGQGVSILINQQKALSLLVTGTQDSLEIVCKAYNLIDNASDSTLASWYNGDIAASPVILLQLLLSESQVTSIEFKSLETTAQTTEV